MIVQETFYGVKCDRCGTMYDECEYQYWDTEQTAVENVEDSDWREVEDKHYCPTATKRTKIREKLRFTKHFKTQKTMWIQHENRIINLQLVTDIDMDGCVIDLDYGDGLVSIVLQDEEAAKRALEKIKSILNPTSI